MKKTYVLDTNVLLSSPYAIHSFDEHDIVISYITLEELDKLKSSSGETGANAREAIRILEKMREQGDLTKGVLLPSGGVFSIMIDSDKMALPSNWDTKNPDNEILKSCICLKSQKVNAILVSNDINMRIKADYLGIQAEEYKTEQMQSLENQYTGRTEAYAPKEVIDKLYNCRIINLEEIDLEIPLTVNEFILLKDISSPSHTALGRFDGEYIIPLKYENQRPYGITPRNMGQRFAQEALLTPANKAPLVILKGPAGTAKTFYSLAVGLSQVIEVKEPMYSRILIARPNIKFDEDIGYLKGSEEEKIDPLLRPVKDNLEILTKFKGKDQIEHSYVQYLFDQGYITAEALAYMRGRSISDTWIIIDEAQNLSPTQAFGIISRAGMNSKVILVGDPEQIDTPRLTSRNNGLVYASEKMRGSPLCWQLTFKEAECVRSTLAKEAIERLSPKGYLSV